MAWPTEVLLPLLAEAGECVTVADIAAGAGRPRKDCQRSLDVLRRRGLVERFRKDCYRLTSDGRRMIEAGARVRSGPRKPHTGRPPARRGESLYGRLWTVLRRRRKATIPELLTVAATGNEANAPGNAATYLSALVKAGFVVTMARREPGTKPTSPGFVKYLVVDDPGPKAPVWRKRHGEIYDPNSGETIDLDAGETQGETG